MHRAFLTWVLALFVAGCSASQPISHGSSTSHSAPPAPIQSPTPLSEHDTILHGIRLGTAVDDARKLLANPVLEQSPEDGQYFWEGDKRGVAVFFKNGIVWRIDDQLGPSPRGLKIGDPVERVELFYGKAGEINRGYMHYQLPGGSRFVVHVLQERVVEIMVMNNRVAELEPEPGRELQPGKPFEPFGAQDHYLAGVKACSPITDLRADKRFTETLGSSDRGTSLEFVTADRFVLVYPQDSSSGRADYIVISGGSYETPQGVRVGDPISRAKVLYGTDKPSDADVALDFRVNPHGRIESVMLRCIRTGPPSPSQMPPNTPLTRQITFDAQLGDVGPELVMKRGYQTYEYPLAEGAQLLRKGKPLSPTELRAGMRVRVTVQDDKIIKLEDLAESTPTQR